MGNAAIPARRLIFVACPAPETYCIIKGTNTPSCTVNGICGVVLRSGKYAYWLLHV